MNLNIREIDPEARGLLYRLQAEQNLPNLAETIKFLVKNYYAKDTGSHRTTPTQEIFCSKGGHRNQL
jgi:hypothetical protein